MSDPPSTAAADPSPAAAGQDATGARPAAAPSGPLLVAIHGRLDQAVAAARPLESQLRARFASFHPEVLVVDVRAGEATLVPAGPAAPADGGQDQALVASQGAIPGQVSPLGPLLRLGAARGAVAMAIVAAEAHDDSVDWLDRLLSPVVEGSFDLVCPAYRRHRTDGAINTGIVAPLVRALYGRTLRQPLGTEAALSPGLARRLVADPDWRRRPAEAGSDAWLVAKTLGGDDRVAQAWLGAWPRPAGEPEELSQALVRALGLVFVEMERSADGWQRTRPARPVPSFGSAGFEPGGERLEPARLVEAFSRGLRDLAPIWSLVLPPATLLALERAARKPPDAFEIGDDVWARVIFDFAVAHMTRAVERRQLLRSLAPLYLGWLAGLARDAATLDDAAFEARLEGIATAFEREKRYLIGRWRWPDDFNP